MSTAELIREMQLPDEESAARAADAVANLETFLRDHPEPPSSVRLVATEDNAEPVAIEIPVSALRLFIGVLAQLANGNAVTIAPVHAELTTQQAADLLNVSRPYLVSLLEERKMPFRQVGNRRRVRLQDLLDYKRRDDSQRRKVLAELTSEAQKLGIEY